MPKSMPSYKEKAFSVFSYYEDLGQYFAGKEDSLSREILIAVSGMRDSFQKNGKTFLAATQKLKEIERYIAKADLEFAYPEIPQKDADADIYLFQDQNYKSENAWLA